MSERTYAYRHSAVMYGLGFISGFVVAALNYLVLIAMRY